MAIPDLTPDEIGAFRRQRRRTIEARDQGKAQLRHDRTYANLAHTNAVGDLREQFRRQRVGFDGQFQARGLQRSGIFQNNLRQMLGDQMRQSRDMALRRQEQLGGFNLAQQQIAQTSHGLLADLEDQERRRRDTIAAALRNAGFGGA